MRLTAEADRQSRKIIPGHVPLIPALLETNFARGNIDTPLWMYGHLGKASHAAHAVSTLPILVRSLAALHPLRQGKQNCGRRGIYKL